MRLCFTIILVSGVGAAGAEDSFNIDPVGYHHHHEPQPRAPRPFCTCGWTHPSGCSSCVEAAAFAVVGVPCGAEKVKCELAVFAGQRNFSSPGSGRGTDGRTDRRSAGRPVPLSPGHRTCRSQLVTSYRLWIIVVGGNLISNPQSSRDAAWWPVDHGRGRAQLVINIINR